MKSKKLLLGLFVALLVCSSSISFAQNKANYQSSNLIEMGPSNLGGRINCIIADRSDATGNTMYAGAANGGLYQKAGGGDWHFVPCYLSDHSQLTLPITSMVQTADYTIYLATGEYGYMNANNIAPMAARGRGIWALDHATNEFTQLIDPATATDFTYINKIALYEEGSSQRMYAATESGLFTSVDNWENYTKVFDGPICDIEVVSSRNIVYFSTPGAIYRISNAATPGTPVCITNNETAFATAGGNIKIAVAQADPNYLYALLFDNKGTFKGVYLTTNQQSWLLLNTSAVAPFTKLHNGNNCGTIAVDLANPKRIYVGGETLWAGQGYVDNTYYQWTMCSYSESTMNMGDYMATVYNNISSVHSGIHQILPIYGPNRFSGLMSTTYFIATDGGIYSSANELMGFINENAGLNALMVNNFAICPDGSLIMGAYGAASPFIESRMAHDGGEVNNSWYDNSTNWNHFANVLFTGNGGAPAASAFQQFAPTAHRGIFVSADGGQFGRAYKDYSDYTNTQTWTTGTEFSSDLVYSGYDIPEMALWETKNNTTINDSVIVNLDTLGYITRNGVDTNLCNGFEILAGDKIRLSHPGFFGYPFEHTFTEGFTISEATEKIKVPSPLHNRLFMTAKKTMGRNSTLLMNWTPTDFRKVWRAEDEGDSRLDVCMNWASIVEVSAKNGYNIRHIAVSNDGDAVFAAISDSVNDAYFVIRVRGLNAVDISNISDAKSKYFNFDGSTYRRTIVDTLQYQGDIKFFRPITSMAFDPRAGKDMLVMTFGGNDGTYSNVMSISNATADSYTINENKAVAGGAVPAYSAMVEYTTGEVYIGTEDGVFVASESSFNGTPAWEAYGEFAGVPVTAMHQQIHNLPIERITTHNGINVENNVFAKTKYPYAMYFATYGRGIFADMKYVEDRENEIVDPTDYLDIPTLKTVGDNSVRVYPNPATSYTNIELNILSAGNAIVKIYDLTGKVVYNENYGKLAEGTYKKTINCQNLRDRKSVV